MENKIFVKEFNHDTQQWERCPDLEEDYQEARKDGAEHTDAFYYIIGEIKDYISEIADIRIIMAISDDDKNYTYFSFGDYVLKPVIIRGDNEHKIDTIQYVLKKMNLYPARIDNTSITAPDLNGIESVQKLIRNVIQEGFLWQWKINPDMIFVSEVRD